MTRAECLIYDRQHRTAAVDILWRIRVQTVLPKCSSQPSTLQFTCDLPIDSIGVRFQPTQESRLVSSILYCRNAKSQRVVFVKSMVTFRGCTCEADRSIQGGEQLLRTTVWLEDV
jgi:hypothetical protein